MWIKNSSVQQNNFSLQEFNFAEYKHTTRNTETCKLKKYLPKKSAVPNQTISRCHDFKRKLVYIISMSSQHIKEKAFQGKNVSF